MPEKLTSEIATDAETITETVTLGGTTYEIEVEDITLGELNELEERERSGEATYLELIADMWDGYLLTPDVAPTDVPRSRVRAITRGMYRAWGAADSDIDAAMEELETPDEGN
jgi:hypothetical protein